MKIKTLALAIAASTLPMTGAFAAALDRSGQSMAIFLEDGNYAEAGVSLLSADVTGKEGGVTPTSRDIPDVAKDYVFGHAGIKLQPTKNFSIGVLYDQPFGAEAEYKGSNIMVSNPGVDSAFTQSQLEEAAFNKLSDIDKVGAVLTAQGVDLTTDAGKAQLKSTVAAYNNDENVKSSIDSLVKANITTKINTLLQQAGSLLKAADANLGKGATDVSVVTHSISIPIGFQPTENFNIYAGPVYQRVKGKVQLRGQASSLLNGYDADIKTSDAWGWLAGVAYQIPEIALKASITYRSKINYDIQMNESISYLNGLVAAADTNAIVAAQIDAVTTQMFDGLTSADIKKLLATQEKTKFSTPQSVNLDFQTGIMENTGIFANVRWVNWKDFVIKPYKFGAVADKTGGFNLVDYSEDQWSANLGIGRKINDKWAGSLSVGWDSGAGNPVSVLGPTDGYWNVGLGVKYNPAENYFVALGVKYFWLGDAKGQSGAQSGTDKYVAEFKDNTAIAGGLRIGYKF